MALVSTDDRHYKNIAQAIRNKLGTEELLLPEQMAGAINSIGGFMKNYQGTTIHADDTYYCNMVANRNKIEVLGQTIQNCLDHSSADKFNNFDGTVDENGYIVINADGNQKKFYNKKESLVLKPSTKYTFIIEVLENTATTGALGFGASGNTCLFSDSKSINITDFKGIVKFTLDTVADFSTGNTGIANVVANITTSGSIKFRYAIVEGDWTNKEVSYVPFGLNYPETTEIVETGKNLFNIKTLLPTKKTVDGVTYEPYTERRINIDKPLASVSDTIRDRYYVQNGRKYHEQNCKTIVYNGTEDSWEIYENQELGILKCFRIKNNDIPNIQGDGYNIGLISNRFNCGGYVSKYLKVGIGFSEEQLIYFRLDDQQFSSINSIDDFKNWLKSNNVEVLYQVKTPITTEIETEDWYSFNEQTNITTTNEVKTPMDLDVPTALVINSGKEM